MTGSAAPIHERSLLRTLDRVLRGDYLQAQSLADGRIEIPAVRLVQLALLLGAIYGACVGSFAFFSGSPHAWAQMLSAAIKIPLMFLLTLIVTFPSLYVVAALQRLPFRGVDMLRLLLVVILTHLAVVASLGPVFAFFAASSGSYAFLKLLNVVFLVLGGLMSFGVLRRATRHMLTANEAAAGSNRTAGQAQAMLRVWCVVYGVVGAQMGWLLRPFLGDPALPFALVRERDGNIFLGILLSLRELFRP